MREENISKMNFKELRAEVQLLRDELAIMKRKYEDMIYNLDDGNFSASVIREKGNMKSEIAASAAEIRTKVSQEDLDGALSNYSTISQTAEHIQMAVVKGVKLSGAVATDKQPTLSAEFDKTKYYLYQNTPYYFNTISQKWEAVEGDSVFTMFQQTADGFLLKGNTVIDGETTVTRNLTLSGNVTWDMENSPVKTQYSPTGSVWHDAQATGDMYMRMSFDGGRTWSNPTKVVGTDGTDGADGSDGRDGSDANVTPENVFNALTDNGAQQGLFNAFYDGGNKLFINAEYIKTGQLAADRIDTSDLACERLYAKGYKDGYYAKMASNVGDFGIYNPHATSGANPASGNCVWGMYNSDIVTETVNFYVYGTNYLGYNGNQNKMYPKIPWDFQNGLLLNLSLIHI